MSFVNMCDCVYKYNNVQKTWGKAWLRKQLCWESTREVNQWINRHILFKATGLCFTSACMFFVSICMSHSKRVTTAASLSHTDPLPPPFATTCQTCYIISVKATAAIKLEGTLNTFVFFKNFWHENITSVFYDQQCRFFLEILQLVLFYFKSITSTCLKKGINTDCGLYRLN